MKKFITPTLQISIGLLSLTISLIFVAYSFGLLPSERNAILEARAKISENLAVQIATLASSGDLLAIKETMESVISRNDDIVSIGVRDANQKLLVEVGDHDDHWLEPADGKSTATHVLVQFGDANAAQERVEIVFRPLNMKENIFGLPKALTAFIVFIGSAGLAGYYVFLKRSLRELDPSRAMPERVQAAFDTLAEGVLIMDEGKYILLANQAFSENIYPIADSLSGIDASELPWLQPDGNARVSELPWRTAVRERRPVLGVSMGIRDRFGSLHKLMVNATCIMDGRGAVRGVIATFDDVTVLHQTNEQLHASIEQLHISQLKISEQNRQLQYLATSDPLTGCLNRRTFFAEAEHVLQRARNENLQLSLLMLDADHFKSINDRFGHMVGDHVLCGAVEVIKKICNQGDLVGRYGGEEFCILVARLAANDVEKLAEQIRHAIAEVTTWLPKGERVTVSIGIASLTGIARQIADLVKRADEALYAAKASGRNRFVNWTSLPLLRSPATAPAQSQLSKESREHFPSTAVPTIDQKVNGGLAKNRNQEPTLEYIDTMIRGDNGDRRFAIARIDIDNLDYFYERYDCKIGDALLKNIEQRITSRFRRSDVLIRLSLSEFLLVFEPLQSKQQIEPIVARIRNELKQPFQIEGFELFCSCSIGVSIYPDHGRSYIALQKSADSAKARARNSAKGEAVFFDANIAQAASARMAAEQRLWRAIEDKKFRCAFQPKVDIGRQCAVGFEALVRWQDDNGDIHLPEEFIGLATELGCIDQITDFVFDAAVNSVDRLDAVFGSGTTVSINMAASLANDPEFMLPFVRKIKGSTVSNRIVLELTEDSFVGKGSFQEAIIPTLREIGVGISIDDFGKGYSSLRTLADVAADEIKIDQSFIKGIHRNVRNQSILQAIVSLGKTLNLAVVAEGVETFDELAYLQAETSIRYAQGYYFSEPFYLDDMSAAKNLFLGTCFAEAG